MTKYQEDAFSKMIYNDLFVDNISLDVMISTVTFPPSVIYVPDSYFRPKQTFSSRIFFFVLGVYQVYDFFICSDFSPLNAWLPQAFNTSRKFTS